MNNTGLLIGLAYRKKDIETEKESCAYQDGLYTRFVEGRIFEFNRILYVLQISNVLSETEAKDLKVETSQWGGES